MRKLALLLLVLLSSTAVARAQGDLVGNYTLVMTEDAAWHRHVLVIESADSSGAKGVLKLDRGLGPEARAPLPDERVHELPFTGRWSKSGGLHFEVVVGQEQPLHYSFELYPVRRGTAALVGVVTVSAETREITAGPVRHGVWAGRD